VLFSNISPMEFLMTYGWAILVVLIAIGALAYFGVLNPGRFLPSSCTVTPGISCEDFVVVDADDTITLTLRNGMGDDINDVQVNITVPDTGAVVCGLTCSNGCSAGSMPDGTLTTWTSTGCNNTGTAASKFKGDVKFFYNSSGGVTHVKTGSITTQVE